MENIKSTSVNHNAPSSIYFNNSNGEEVLKLCGNGDILVKGKLIENDKEVVDALREFLKGINFLK